MVFVYVQKASGITFSHARAGVNFMTSSTLSIETVIISPALRALSSFRVDLWNHMTTI